MSIDTPFRTSPQLGPQLNEVFTTLPYWDSQLGVGYTVTPSPSYKLGNRETGNDGVDYIWVKASAQIAATAATGTQVTVANGTYLSAAGSGGWYSPVDTVIPAGAYFHARRGAYNAAPA